MKDKRNKDGWKRVVNNKMKWFGETNTEKHIIKVNKKIHKQKKHGAKVLGKKLSRGELFDTIFHEEYHAKHPRASEKTTQKMTKMKAKKVPLKTRKRLYAYYQK